jgi:hypothetical protein
MRNRAKWENYFYKIYIKFLRVIVMGNYRLRIDSIKSSFGIIDFPRIEYFYFTKDEFNQLCDRFDIANEYIEAAQRYYNGIFFYYKITNAAFY